MNNRIGIRARLAVVAALAAGLGVFAAPSAAQAAEVSVCSTGFGSGCETRDVQAVGANVRIVLVAPPAGACYYEVSDTYNGVVVRKGSFWGGLNSTINGLYSRYKVVLFGCPGFSEAHISG